MQYVLKRDALLDVQDIRVNIQADSVRMMVVTPSEPEHGEKISVLKEQLEPSHDRTAELQRRGRFTTSLLAVDTQPTPPSIRSHSAGKRGREGGEGKKDEDARVCVCGASERAEGPRGRPRVPRHMFSLSQSCRHLWNNLLVMTRRRAARLDTSAINGAAS